MKNILLIEDEMAAAKRMSVLLSELLPGCNVVAILESVRQAIKWFNSNTMPDLIIADIQLADGLSFEIFKQVKTDTPIIFATAYDEYTLKAFKLNSIDYLLKPVDKNELKQALDKFERVSAVGSHKISEQLHDVMSQMIRTQNAYKSRFLIARGDKLISVPVSELAFIKADDKIVTLTTDSGQKYLIDDTLEEVEKCLDPSLCFRINRSYIASIKAIEKCEKHFNGRLKINIKGCSDDEIFVSREKASLFKNWLNM